MGALVFNVHGHLFQQSGWPDLQVYHPIWTGHLELKVRDNPAEPLQRSVINALRARKTKAYVMRLWESGKVTVEDADWNILMSFEREVKDGLELLRELRKLGV